MLTANWRLTIGDSEGALLKVQEARDNGADQAQVEACNAYALHLSGAPIGDCIAAYEVALSIDPDIPNLRLNLAQLLFAQGDSERAQRELPSPDLLENDGKLERLFYELAHTGADSRSVAATMRLLLSQGARTQWSFTPNINKVASQDPAKGRLLHEVADALRGDDTTSVLDRLEDGSG